MGYRLKKIFAPYLHLVHCPFTIFSGYYSRDSASSAEGSIEIGARFHPSGGSLPSHSCSIPAPDSGTARCSGQAAYSCRSGPIPVAPGAERRRPRRGLPPALQGLQHRVGRGAGKLVSNRPRHRSVRPVLRASAGRGQGRPPHRGHVSDAVRNHRRSQPGLLLRAGVPLCSV